MPPGAVFCAMPSVMPSAGRSSRLHACGESPSTAEPVTNLIQNWRGRDGNDPSVDIAKDADQRF